MPVSSAHMRMLLAGFGDDALKYAKRLAVTTDARYGEYKAQKSTCDKSRIQSAPDSDSARTVGQALIFIPPSRAVELMKARGHCPAGRHMCMQRGLGEWWALGECCQGYAAHGSHAVLAAAAHEAYGLHLPA
jgi:hypothetical protein